MQKLWEEYMMEQLAKAILEQENRTCVLCGEGRVYKSDRRGVAPLLELLDNGTQVTGFFAADRVVGKATAFLYCLLGVKAVYAKVMSKPAAEVLTKMGIAHSWDALVEGIQNRQKNGPCPMEYATRDCRTAEEALAAIRSKLKELALTNK